eukprot:TRINITY_DN12243_c0_g1_i13.p1 TRINITY_DN12243_c0_g1~~TRINITY_DN12243_c0_g1_i13.p1  ORF type:complete len:207 (-),score=34.30 TRINITY_DN12243_c0_g1_i13:109-729(-)
MPDCNALIFCFLGLIVTFSFLLNLSEAYITINDIRRTVKEYEGKLFDCNYYPLVCRLIVTCYTSFLSFICVLCSFSLMSFNSEHVLWSVVMYLLYTAFGPVMALICFFILFNYDHFGYTCDQELDKVYNPMVWVMVTFLCLVGLTITVMARTKILIEKLGCLAYSIWISKLANFLLCESDELLNFERQENPEELGRLREEQLRPQL